MCSFASVSDFERYGLRRTFSCAMPWHLWDMPGLLHDFIGQPISQTHQQIPVFPFMIRQPLTFTYPTLLNFLCWPQSTFSIARMPAVRSGMGLKFQHTFLFLGVAQEVTRTGDNSLARLQETGFRGLFSVTEMFTSDWTSKWSNFVWCVQQFWIVAKQVPGACVMLLMKQRAFMQFQNTNSWS